MRDAVNLEPPTGTFGLKADYGADLKGEDPQVTLADASVALSGLTLKLHGAAAPFMELQDARIDGMGFDLARQQVDIGKVALHGGRARLAVDEGGTMNLERIAKAAGKPAASRPAPDRHVRPWKVKLNALELEKFALDFKNLSRTPGFKAAVGDLKVRLTAEAEAGDQTRMRLSDLDVGLADLQAGFAEAAEPTLRASKAELQGGAYDLTGNLFTAEKAAAAGGSVDVRRQPDGVLNLMLLFAPPDKGAIVEAIQEAAAEAAAEGHPFRFLVKTAALADFRAALTDEMVKSDGPLLNLDEISAVLSNVDGKSPMTFEAGVQVREGGRMKAAGRIDPSGPAVEAEIQVAELGLVPFQPYLAQAAAVDLKSGAFSTKGNLRHGIKAAGAQTAYRGGFSVDNLRITEAGGKETLVGWSTVQTEQLALQIEPNGLEIGDLRVSQLGGKFIIEKDRSLNFTRVIKSDPAAKKAEKPQAAADPFPYRVRRVLVSGGLVNFADLSLLTPFGTKIHELKGIVAGVSSTRGARAQVKLDGRVDEYGTANIDGELNTSDPKAFTHISVVFRNVEMSRLTPYSGKFAGRKINSGKLSVDLKYKIDKSRLAGDNRIVVERLALGDKVESPVAVNLPLDLAVALLEDTNGLIDLGLPVSGNLDSPEFSFGALIWKAFANLITKIVTSPFRALGALLPGGGDETSNSVAFEPGRPDVPPPEKEKLARLADALQKRPQIRLSVQGRFNPQSDLAELRILNLSRNLTARLGQKPVPGEDPGPVDFSSPETGKALEALFAQRFGADALQALKAELKAADEKETWRRPADPRRRPPPHRLQQAAHPDRQPAADPALLRRRDPFQLESGRPGDRLRPCRRRADRRRPPLPGGCPDSCRGALGPGDLRPFSTPEPGDPAETLRRRPAPGASPGHHRPAVLPPRAAAPQPAAGRVPLRQPGRGERGLLLLHVPGRFRRAGIHGPRRTGGQRHELRQKELALCQLGHRGRNPPRGRGPFQVRRGVRLSCISEGSGAQGLRIRRGGGPAGAGAADDRFRRRQAVVLASGDFLPAGRPVCARARALSGPGVRAPEKRPAVFRGQAAGLPERGSPGPGRRVAHQLPGPDPARPGKPRAPGRPRPPPLRGGGRLRRRHRLLGPGRPAGGPQGGRKPGSDLMRRPSPGGAARFSTIARGGAAGETSRPPSRGSW